MFKQKTAKDIKEATKILSYLGRAEKYFDLELVKKGRPVKPLLQIADIIDPLRQIAEVAQRVENDDPLPAYSAEAFEAAERICEVTDDIITLNPRGLVSSDKATLTRLRENINVIQQRAAVDPTFNKPASAAQAQPATAAATEQPQESFRIVDAYKFPEQQESQLSYNYELSQKPVSNFYQEPANSFYEPEFGSSQNYNERFSLASAEQQFAHQNYQQQPQSQQQSQGQNTNGGEAKIYQIHPVKREQGNLANNYLATTYPGMNLQEAADIIEELARNPKNHNVVLLEHASQTKPIPLGVDIIEDLRALAPIADAIENSTEIVNKEPIKLLSKAEQIITICTDISALSIDGLDVRKKKLLGKFIRQDISKLAAVARNAYPEAFSPTTDNFGELTTNTLVDFAELLSNKARYHEERMYAEILALISYQIAEYANYNEIRTKFDVLIKKNRINSSPKVFDTKIKMAWLRAVTYVPQIARHSQEIAALPQTNDFERRLIEKSLEILQLAYIEARDKYASYLQDFSLLKVA